jgi:elongation factor 1 alpha-like protein
VKSPLPQAPAPTSQSVDESKEPESQQSAPNIRALPSTFASTIVGTAGPSVAEPSHLNSSGTDLLKIYGQDNAEPFDFAAPSPDDVVLNAQSTAKGLAIRRKV